MRFRCVHAETIPVTNAFCNCPLNPDFQGLMSFTARVRQTQNMMVATITTKIATNTPIIYFPLSPECSSSFFVPLALPTAWWGGDSAGEREGFFFSLGIAGNEPLLLVLGTAIMVSSGEGPLTRAATKLTDSPASLRRTVLTRVVICGSIAPAECENSTSVKFLNFQSLLFTY